MKTNKKGKKASYYEKDLESAIISHLADFLLEMGKGFSFVARQKRLLVEDDEFFVDLVFYNRLLRSSSYQWRGERLSGEGGATGLDANFREV